MDNDTNEDRQGNEPSPLLFLAAGLVPLLGVAAWWIFFTIVIGCEALL